jgi:hypothetical protein
MMEEVKILCNVRALLHGVTSKTAKFTLSAMTETTGMNAIHDIIWQTARCSTQQHILITDHGFEYC